MEEYTLAAHEMTLTVTLSELRVFSQLNSLAGCVCVHAHVCVGS